MAYTFKIGNIILPIAPEKIDININGNNKTMNLINDGEINILKKVGLTTISFDFLLPNISWINSFGQEVSYPFAIYEEGYKSASELIKELNEMKISLEPFQFVIMRTLPNGNRLFDTSLKMAIEDYTLKESSKNGFDIVVSIKLKEYKDYNVKDISSNNTTSTKREESKSPEPKSEPKKHTVKSGDSLWAIAKQYYGDGSKYTKIASANSNITNPNNIQIGQVITIPI